MVSGGGALGRDSCREGRALMRGTNALLKEALQSSVAPSTTWGHRQKFCEPGSESLTRQLMGRHLDRGLPSLQKSKKLISTAYKPSRLRHFVTATQTDRERLRKLSCCSRCHPTGVDLRHREIRKLTQGCTAGTQLRLWGSSVPFFFFLC